MSALRRLSHDMRYLLMNSSKQTFQSSSVTCIKSPLATQNYFRTDFNTQYQISGKCNFHTTSINRDIETGMKAIGAGFSMVGAIGSGAGIGVLYGNLVASIARNPSTKDQLFVMALMGTAFCETICLFCFVVSMIILFS